MGRPAKKGLDYFLSDIDFWNNGKIIDLAEEYGPIGICVYDVIVRLVYKNGYYLETSIKALSQLVMRTIGSRWIKNKSLVVQVIDYCAEIGLFDKGLLSQNVITSAEIQEHYDHVTARNKVDKRKYWLSETAQTAYTAASSERVSVTETPVAAAETPVNEEVIRQSRVEKSRSDKSRVEESRVEERKVDESRSDKSRVEESRVVERKVDESRSDKSGVDESRVMESRVEESRANGGIQNHNTHLQIPCKDGVFSLDDHYYTELLKTYPEMCIDDSLKKMCTYLTLNPEKQRRKSAVASYMMMWLERDNQSGKYRLSKPPISAEYASQYTMADYIADYESHSVVDEL